MIDPLKYTTTSDKALERSVIMEILMVKSVQPSLKSHYFTGQEYKLFCDILKQWSAHREIDIEVLRVTHSDTIETVLGSGGTDSNVAIELLKQQWLIRRKGEILIASDMVDDATESLKLMQRMASESLLSKLDVVYNQSEEVSSLLEDLERQIVDGKGIRGYSLGMPMVDIAIGGIERGKVYAFGALKKTGKSRFMSACAVKLSQAGCGVVINSLEMSKKSLNLLALANVSGIDTSGFSRMLRPEQMANFNTGVSACNELNWHIYQEYTVQDLWSRVEFLRTKHKIDIVFVDFIQRMKNPTYRSDRVREVESVAMELANMARELNVAVFVLCQLSGAAESLEKDVIPDMRHLKESQGIAENADCIITLHNPERHESPYTAQGDYKYQNFRMLIEQREGISGSVIDITSDLRCCRFWDSSGN